MPKQQDILVRQLRCEMAFELYVKGHPFGAIARRLDIPLVEVKSLIAAASAERLADRRNTDKFEQDFEASIAYYQHVKATMLERAEKADDKHVAELVKRANDAQNSIDKLLGLHGLTTAQQLKDQQAEQLIGVVSYRRILSPGESLEMLPVKEVETLEGSAQLAANTPVEPPVNRFADIA